MLAQFPALDALINNAGIMRNLNLHQERELHDVTREIDINLSGPVRMIQGFLPHLKSRPEAMIVNVSSGLAFIPLPISPVYCATKAALHSFTQSLRVQLEGTRVAVIELAPPIVETPLFRNEFAKVMEGQTGMDVEVLVRGALASIEAGRVELRPGFSNVLKAMSRIAPQFMPPQAREHIQGERPAQQPGLVQTGCALLPRLLHRRGKGGALLLQPRLRPCLREQKWTHFRAWGKDAVEPRFMR